LEAPPPQEALAPRLPCPRLDLRTNEYPAFKIRLVSLFHAVVSLQNLLNKNQSDPLLHPEVVQQISTMLGADVIRRLCRRKPLRDNLVHYGVNDHTVPNPTADLSLCGLVEALASGQSFGDVAGDVGLGLDRIYEGLFSLLPHLLTPQGTL
jgi:hypothetical protein